MGDSGLEAARRLQYASRRPLTAFMVFAGEMRSQVLRANPENTPDAVLGRQLVERWTTLSTAEKKKYEKKSVADRAFLLKLSKSSTAAKPVVQKPAPKKRKVRDAHAPKNAMTAYMYYSKAARPKIKERNPTATFGELGKLIGTGWRNLSDADKTPYEELAKKDKERYIAAKAVYMEKLKKARLANPNSDTLADSNLKGKGKEKISAKRAAALKKAVMGSPQLLALALQRHLSKSPSFGAGKQNALALQAAKRAVKGSPVIPSGFQLMQLGTAPGSPRILVRTGPVAPANLKLSGGSPQQQAAQAQIYSAAAREKLLAELKQNQERLKSQNSPNLETSIETEKEEAADIEVAKIAQISPDAETPSTNNDDTNNIEASSNVCNELDETTSIQTSGTVTPVSDITTPETPAELSTDVVRDVVVEERSAQLDSVAPESELNPGVFEQLRNLPKPSPPASDEKNV